MRSIFILTIFSALVCLYIRGTNWQNRISYFTNGATLGLVASAAAYGVFSTGKWTRRIGIPLASVTAIVVIDITVGGVTYMWQGPVLDRLGYVSMFALCLGISPLLSFVLLKQLGYRLSIR